MRSLAVRHVLLGFGLALAASLSGCARERGPAQSPQQTQPYGHGAPYGGQPQTPPYGQPYPPSGQPGAVPTAQPPAPPAAPAQPDLGTALIALGNLVRQLPGVLVVPPVGAPPAGTTAVPPGVPPPAAPPPGPDAAPPQWSAFEDEVLRLTNQQRALGATCGGRAMPPVGPVAFHGSLRAAARSHSRDMGERQYFDHDSPEGVQPHQRAQAAGYPNAYVGENIGSGYTDAARAMAGWMASTGHCLNVMKGDYAFLGVGYAYTDKGVYHHYWTQVFGGRLPGRWGLAGPGESDSRRRVG